MDIVYVVRPGERNEELRYSLRSLVNLPHDRVWIAGHCPAWVAGVGHISVKQTETKWENSTLNLMGAASHPEVSDEFVYFNDDFFVMSPIESVPTLHRGRVVDVESDYQQRGYSSAYVDGMRATARFLESLGCADPLSYELHLPMVFGKARLAEALRLPLRLGVRLPVLHKRTLYGNYWRVGGDQVEDCKVTTSTMSWSGLLGVHPFVSTSDSSFTRSTVGRLIRSAFPDPGRYEHGRRSVGWQGPVRRTWRHSRDGRQRTVRVGSALDRHYAPHPEWLPAEEESDGAALAS